MKRKRVEEMEKEKKEGSEMSCAIEALSMGVLKFKADDHSTTAHIATKPFLCVCRNLLLHVLDKIGSSMTVLRQDIHQNIQKEATEGIAKKGSSCSKAFVWLTRSLDFSLALLQQLVEDFEKNMERAVEESYTITLKPWHGWISSAAYKVALKLVPDTRSLITILMARDKNSDILKKEMQALISLLEPALQEIHNLLEIYGLDRLKSI
ncbi:PREDICTED: glycolipid transfer protein 3-like isoform X2 [Ipomoea nil]|uniref:glycolipid transfer protein 3-like isoform X2 n=1 Tax=Ipomoea nil TaxID=35883 RepID=UPI00090144EF|nr:PREDICTED: glycolipid transfer protein 3-like isoform X2 [Ipomoea nil]